MVPPDLSFWSISRKGILESQQKHAPQKKTFLRAVLDSNDISIPGYNQKMLNTKKTSIPEKNWFNYELFFHLVICTA